MVASRPALSLKDLKLENVLETLRRSFCPGGSIYKRYQRNDDIQSL
jgi:hypothetical protein